MGAEGDMHSATPAALRSKGQHREGSQQEEAHGAYHFSPIQPEQARKATRLAMLSEADLRA